MYLVKNILYFLYCLQVFKYKLYCICVSYTINIWAAQTEKVIHFYSYGAFFFHVSLFLSHWTVYPYTNQLYRDTFSLTERQIVFSSAVLPTPSRWLKNHGEHMLSYASECYTSTFSTAVKCGCCHLSIFLGTLKGSFSC